jgi:hypothetical protein
MDTLRQQFEAQPEKKEVSTTPVVPEEKDEYVSKFLHIQEDLKYMFGITVEHEEDLYQPLIREKIYSKAINDFLQGNPFTLEYFLEEHILEPEDINAKDIPSLREAAKRVTASMRHTGRRKASKELFVRAGIFTQEEADSLPSIH